MNESLTEAIALGHDLGHTPFGHAGEYILNEICEDGFAHYKQSVRVVEILAKKGTGVEPHKGSPRRNVKSQNVRKSGDHGGKDRAVLR